MGLGSKKCAIHGCLNPAEHMNDSFVCCYHHLAAGGIIDRHHPDCMEAAKQMVERGVGLLLESDDGEVLVRPDVGKSGSRPCERIGCEKPATHRTHFDLPFSGTHDIYTCWECRPSIETPGWKGVELLGGLPGGHHPEVIIIDEPAKDEARPVVPSTPHAKAIADILGAAAPAPSPYEEPLPKMQKWSNKVPDEPGNYWFINLTEHPPIPRVGYLDRVSPFAYQMTAARNRETYGFRADEQRYLWMPMETPEIPAGVVVDGAWRPI